MEATYWLTFRIHEDATYEQRRDRLYAAINDIAAPWWVEPTSFIAFASETSADMIAAKVKAAFNPVTDIALLGMTDFKTARLIGNSKDPDIYALIPFLKKV
jgi:hypothetical protein